MARERGVYPFSLSDFHDDPDGYEFEHDGAALSAGIKYDNARARHDFYADFETYLKSNGLWDKIVKSSRKKDKKTSRAKKR